MVDHAEREGFEPSIALRLFQFSRLALSTTQTPLLVRQRTEECPSAFVCIFTICGEGGIRTHGTLTGTLPFQGSQFNHSCTSPDEIAVQIYKNISEFQLHFFYCSDVSILYAQHLSAAVVN